MLDKELVAYLEKQKETEYKFEDTDKLELAYKLIDNIGDHDSHIRDELIYPNLAHLLYDKHFDEEQLTEIARLLISPKCLMFDIDNYVEYSVLVRSFSILQLVIIVGVHNRDHIISEKVIHEIYDAFMEYFPLETDVRGYDKEVGWLHSIAHSADLFSQLVKVESLKERELKQMFKAMSYKFRNKDYFFRYDEDERMVTAIYNGLERHILQEDFIKGWIHDFSNYKKITEYPQAYYLTNNIKIFLRSLYFRMLDEEKYRCLFEETAKVLRDNVKVR